VTSDGFDQETTRPGLTREELERELAAELMETAKIPTFLEALEKVRASMTNNPQHERQP